MTASCTRCKTRPVGTPRWEAQRGVCHACYIALGKAGQLAELPLQRATMGVRRDCACKRAQHHHGTYTAYTVDRCRCWPCRDANATYVQSRNRLKAERAWGLNRPATPGDLVDAGPARQHLQQLMAAGMGPKTIAAKNHIGHGSISAILYGKPTSDPTERRPPRRRITRDLEQRILAVQLELADGAFIPAAGTQRRLRALVAIGWSQSELGRRLGLHPSNASTLIARRAQVTVATRRAVCALYDQLWNTPPPEHTRWQQMTATRARRMAADHNWLAPMWWDDDTIDNPDARPATGTRQPGALLEDVEHLLDDDQTPVAILARLDVTRDAVQQACRRAERGDLWTRFLRANPRHLGKAS